MSYISPKKNTSVLRTVKSYFCNQQQMVKLTELSAEQLASLPEEVQQAIIAWKDELLWARQVIASLKKKGEEKVTVPQTKEEMQQLLRETREQEELDNFIQKNPIFEDYKDDLSKAKGFFGNLDDAKNHLLSKNPTLLNNLKTNQTWIGWQSWGGNTSFSWLLTLSSYSWMNSDEKQAYIQYCEKSGHGGLMLKPETQEDL